MQYKYKGSNKLLSPTTLPWKLALQTGHVSVHSLKILANKIIYY
jgi:hypothetical protein